MNEKTKYQQYKENKELINSKNLKNAGAQTRKIVPKGPPASSKNN